MKKAALIILAVFAITAIATVVVRDNDTGGVDEDRAPVDIAKVTDQPSAAMAQLESANTVSADAIKALIGDTLLDNKGSPAELELTDKKLVAFYFSASWCPPCRAFTPGLVSFYEENKDQLEVILISSDRDAASQQRYMDSYNMPWKALRWGSDEGMALAEKFNVQYIPTLVVMDVEGNVITPNGVREFGGSPKKTFRAWQKKAGI